MNCQSCKKSDLIQIVTTNGVVVDCCSACGGIWLDKGEIFYFTSRPALLELRLKEGLKQTKKSDRIDPKTGDPMVIVELIPKVLVIDYNPKNGGIWLDAGELQRLPSVNQAAFKLKIDRNMSNKPQDAALKKTIGGYVPLPNLAFVSGATLFVLYGFLTLALIVLSNFNIIANTTAVFISIAFALVQFLISPFIMDLSLRWMYNVEWVNPENLPADVRDFINRLCAKRHIKFPRFGIIPDGSPNAFTYGHTPNNARVVITRGTQELLAPEELKAVVAHEIGHAVHWDMLVMTTAYLVPLIFYYLFRMLISARSGSRENKNVAAQIVLSVIAYIIYIISEYIVLWFSRVREYYADRFAGDEVDPAHLSSALIKIGYGLAGRSRNTEETKNRNMEAVRAMGIFDPSSAKSLAVSTYSAVSAGTSGIGSESANAMKWDLWNPWAAYYELHSTHPLIAKRVLALSKQSVAMGREPYIIFNETKPESYWDDFLTDIVIALLPAVVFITGAVLSLFTLDMNIVRVSLLLFGLSYLLKVRVSYQSSEFPEMNISSLLKKIKVSGVRPVPCTIKGRIIGRGVPGYIFSEDFVVQDDTGIMFLDYRQPLGIFDFFFGLLRAGGYVGKQVTVKGWYRRSPIPYIEIKTITDSIGDRRCYTYYAKLVFGILASCAGIILFFV